MNPWLSFIMQISNFDNCSSQQVSLKYQNSSTSSMDLPPHAFAFAESIYRSLLSQRMSQCCVISGESGAGKTESCKYLLQHLLTVAQSGEDGLIAKIQRVNPLLEAFGNAKTIMNDNSSRFGKYIEVKLTEDGVVQGGKSLKFSLLGQMNISPWPLTNHQMKRAPFRSCVCMILWLNAYLANVHTTQMSFDVMLYLSLIPDDFELDYQRKNFSAITMQNHGKFFLGIKMKECADVLTSHTRSPTMHSITCVSN